MVKLSILLWIRNWVAGFNKKIIDPNNPIFEPKSETILGELAMQIFFGCALPAGVLMAKIIKLLVKIPSIKIS